MSRSTCSSRIPSKFETPTPRILNEVRARLGEQIIGRSTARSSWAFYEVVDSWLGPWGEGGYPIGYGKRYARAFTTHRRLLASPVARRWVFETARILQEELLEFILERMRAGTLPELGERELRRAAFNRHAAAYDHAGLARVLVLAPEFAPWIGLLSIAEFHPQSENFPATVDQAQRAAVRVLPKAAAFGAYRTCMLPWAIGLAALGSTRASARAL
jgi:hypothetical protein